MGNEDFAICVPTWNSLAYLKLLCESLKENSAFKHPIYVHDNGSNDGTVEWLENEFDGWHWLNAKNEGFCGVNTALAEAYYDQHKYVMVFNTDMVALPRWDVPIVQQIKRFENAKIANFTISSRLVEPTGNNPEYQIANYGTTPETLRKKELYKARFPLAPNTVQYSHPILFPAALLHNVGYFDKTYWPGWSSDHDIAMACHNAGCKHFVMLGNSLIYHFSSATFKQLPENDRAKHGQDIFEKKWKKSVDNFRKDLHIRAPFI